MNSKNRVLLSSLSLVAGLLLNGFTARAETIHVFLIGGQSNANGHAIAAELPASVQAPQADVSYYYDTTGNKDKPAPALVLLSPRKTFGPEVTFGRAMADYYAPSGAKVAILQFAVGGSNLFAHWKPATDAKPDGVLLKLFKKNTTDGMAALQAAHPGATISIDGMVWMQGEADGADKSGVMSAAYADNLTALIKEIRGEFGAQLPFVIGRLSSGQTTVGVHLNDIRAAQEKIAAADPHNKLVDSDSFELFPDHLHFDAVGQQALGKAFATAMQGLVPPQ